MIGLLFAIITGHAIPWYIGYLIVSLADREGKLSAGWKACASLLIGMGALTMGSFVAGIAGLPMRLPVFLAVAGAEMVVGGAWLWLREKRVPLPRLSSASVAVSVHAVPRRSLIISTILFLIITAKIIVSLWQVTHVPTFDFDAWNNWNLRPKAVFSQERIPLNPAEPWYLGGGISSYPLHDAMGKVWLMTLAGEWREDLALAPSIAYYLALILLFFFTLPKEWPLVARSLFTYLLASLPYLYFHTWVGYADVPFASYLFLALSAAHLFFQTGTKAYWYLSAISLGLLIWVKNEGFAIVLPVMAVVFLLYAIAKKYSIRSYLAYMGSVLLTASPWLIFRTANRLDILSGDSSTFRLVWETARFSEWFSALFLRGNFNFLWALFSLLLVLKFREFWKQMPIRFLTLALLGLFAFYNATLLFTDKAQDFGTSMTRINLHTAPLALFLTVIVGCTLYRDWATAKHT